MTSNHQYIAIYHATYSNKPDRSVKEVRQLYKILGDMEGGVKLVGHQVDNYNHKDYIISFDKESDLHYFILVANFPGYTVMAKDQQYWNYQHREWMTVKDIARYLRA